MIKMGKMIHTKYGYVTPEEAKIDGELDRWYRSQTGATAMPSGRIRNNKHKQGFQTRISKTTTWHTTDQMANHQAESVQGTDNAQH